LASAGRDNEVIVWDLTRKVILAKHKSGAVQSAIDWHPGKHHNVLAGIGEDGRVALWKSIIPQSYPGPAALVTAQASHQDHDNTSQDASHGVSCLQSYRIPALGSITWLSAISYKAPNLIS
jgi:WD40 repeat protein